MIPNLKSSGIERVMVHIINRGQSWVAGQKFTFVNLVRKTIIMLTDDSHHAAGKHPS